MSGIPVCMPLREYKYSLPSDGNVYASFYLPATLKAADFSDLRQWLKLIDRQLGRLELAAESRLNGEIEYESWFITEQSATTVKAQS